MAEEYILTREGYDKIVAEYEELVSVKRKEVAARLKEAISYGDLSENAEYDAAKNEQADLEERIFKLENMMKGAKVVDEASKDVVGVGSKVKIRNMDTDEIEEYMIVGASESDPFNGKISNESAVGHHLSGHKKGEKLEFQVPNGIARYEIISISK